MKGSALVSRLPARWRRILAHGFGWLPGNRLRVVAFRLLGHTLPHGTRIGLGAVIACDAPYAGKGVTISRGNRFCGPFTITIGDGAWIAGCDSQFWTHGASAMDRDVAIGHGCYLGAAVRMAPGSAIADRCVLGIASIVASRLDQADTVLGGFPARRLREICPEDSRQFALTMEGWR
jgi:serine acetyltransferase